MLILVLRIVGLLAGIMALGTYIVAIYERSAFLMATACFLLIVSNDLTSSGRCR